MSAHVFPVLPGRDWSSRETIYRTTVREASSGREDRTSWASAPRYKWRIKHNFLRTSVTLAGSWGTLSEVALVQYFIDQHYGNGDSFHIVDPYDGTTDRVVRFVEGSVRLVQLVSGVWTCEFELISVI